MLRSTTRAWRVSLRCFSSANLQRAPSLTHDTDDLLTRVRVLATRGHLTDALSLFYAVDKPHCPQTYATLFHECSRRSFLREGLSLHRHMIAHNPTYPLDTFVSNHLINMYCKFGYLDYAHQLFDEMPHRNLVSWTALVSGYSHHGRAEDCFRLFSAVLAQFRPNEFAFASVLSSCDDDSAKFGTQVHALAMKMRLESHFYVSNALISMYSRIGVCGEDHAWAVFSTAENRNTVTWNSMISVLHSHGLGSCALHLFTKMHRDGVSFDRTTLIVILSSLGFNTCLNSCSQLHCLILKTGFSSEIKVNTALTKAYSDLGADTEDCYKVFSETASHRRDIVSWTSVITALAERDPERALSLFSELRRAEDVSPDWHTLSIVLKACAWLAAEAQASAVHSVAVKSGLGNDTVISNSLVHAYARCGSVSASERAFRGTRARDVVSWNSILKAYALHGRAREALALFETMDVRPDSATFAALLSACSHSGLVKQGAEIFRSMEGNYGITPGADHYACVVDMYGRAGKFDEAERVISEMKTEPDSVIWSSLVGSCRKHGEARLADLAARKLRRLEPGSSLGYVQMSNSYRSTGKFDEAGSVWSEMSEFRVRKEPGLSWVEMGNRAHEFASGGRRRPDREAILDKLDELVAKLKGVGYVPETSSALHDVEEEQKQEQLYHHSEKLALAFCLLNEDSSRGVFKIIKNIRICVDCHEFMKLASGLLRKEILVRDSNRFHSFKDGICTCDDYW